jgi:hypothetical protein
MNSINSLSESIDTSKVLLFIVTYTGLSVNSIVVSSRFMRQEDSNNSYKYKDRGEKTGIQGESKDFLRKAWFP